MLSNLTRFQAIGLHNSVSMDVRITDNKLVLVGENGAGKSTFSNLIYYFLTKQWARLGEYRFARLQASFGDLELVLTPEHIEQHIDARRHFQALLRMTRHSGPTYTRPTSDLFDKLMDLSAADTLIDETVLIERAAHELQVPPSVAKKLLAESLKASKGKPTHIQTLERILSEKVTGQFLFLPTYRRIEQDLRSVFRGVDIESELRKFRERLSRRSGAPFLELVEFGMEDVEQTIVTKMAEIKESVRNGLDALTGAYLRDVIRGVHTKIDAQSLSHVSFHTLDSVFARIDDTTLPLSDKQHLKEKVNAISTTHAIDEQDKVIAHFLLKLVQLHTEQQENERNVREFVSVCNQYLTGKQMIYDNIKYTIFVVGQADSNSKPQPLEMKALSSGEKQIVSLFSHLYLSGEKSFFVVIDEPELSLSVPWQRRFLPDILKTKMCSGLVAVTHSPFVWDNDLEPCVRPLAEFTSKYSAS